MNFATRLPGRGASTNSSRGGRPLTAETPTQQARLGPVARRSLFNAAATTGGGYQASASRMPRLFYGTHSGSSWNPGQIIPTGDISEFANNLADDMADDYDYLGGSATEELQLQHGTSAPRQLASQAQQPPSGYQKLWDDITAFLSTEFGKVNDNISKLDGRIDEMEQTVKTLETKVEDIQNADSSISSSSGSGSGSGNDTSKRQRRSPLSLQVCYQDI